MHVVHLRAPLGVHVHSALLCLTCKIWLGSGANALGRVGALTQFPPTQPFAHAIPNMSQAHHPRNACGTSQGTHWSPFSLCLTLPYLQNLAWEWCEHTRWGWCTYHITPTQGGPQAIPDMSQALPPLECMWYTSGHPLESIFTLPYSALLAKSGLGVVQTHSVGLVHSPNFHQLNRLHRPSLTCPKPTTVRMHVVHLRAPLGVHFHFDLLCLTCKIWLGSGANTVGGVGALTILHQLKGIHRPSLTCPKPHHPLNACGTPHGTPRSPFSLCLTLPYLQNLAWEWCEHTRWG
jgi:hypothetical protein